MNDTNTTGTVTTQPTSPNFSKCQLKVDHEKLGSVPATSPSVTKDPKKGKKSKSKNAKKGRGILCCRRKKKQVKKGRKSKNVHKKPTTVNVPKKAPMAGSKEQLGDIVLVKNQNQPVKKTDVRMIENEGRKEDQVEAKKEEKRDEKMDELKEKWLKLVKRFIEEDAQIAQADFEQAASYIPPHVSKENFVLNLEKNRFADVVCLDHSRVALHDSSYIHANWVNVDGEKNRKAILTQLPLVHTAGDFWQMVIEQRVKCVLLLLTDEEYNTLGGDFVFPQTQDFLHFPERSIRVGEFKCVELGRGWMMRVMSVFNGDYKSFIHVHHLKTWSHNDIPSGGAAGVKQIWQVQSVLRKYTGPIVYMSLSGCGRAGTFVLFEVAHASLHSSDTSFDMVKNLEIVRNGRTHAVQTLSQFSFVYSLLAEHILGNGFCKMQGEKDAEIEENYIREILRQLTIN